MTEIAARIQRMSRLSAGLLALALFSMGASAALFIRALTLRDSVLPGVEVAGIEVGGLERADARARIAENLSARLHTPLQVAIGQERFTVVPAELFELDVAATERRAFEAGRGSVTARLGALATPSGLEQHVEPVLTTRAEGRVEIFRRIFAATERPVQARLRLNGLEPIVIPGRPGTTVDQSALLGSIQAAAFAGVSAIGLDPVRLEPSLRTGEAERAAAAARSLLSAPVAIERLGERLGLLTPTQLARMLSFVAVGGEYRLALDHDLLARRTVPLAGQFLRKPVDAHFKAKGKRVRVVPGRPGTRVDAAALEAAVLSGAASIPLPLTKLTPSFTTQDAYALGIRQRVSTFTTDMGESSANRIWNVQLLGRYLDGTILQPGQTFSYNKVMGPRTIERGFREGQMIWNGVLVPSIGGGVCQTATTIFNAAFEAGLPIKDRLNHSFYISHYPLGRDATVSWGGPDLVFRNDLDHAILIKAHGTTTTFTVSFYGTKQKRKVVATTSEQTNWRSPYLQYAVDPNAPAGSVRTTAGGGPGFDVTVYRKVLEDGKVIRRDKFVSRYTPENPTAVYGAGSTPPGPYFYLPG
jgi:vancomycin resistance protein YoaR